MFAENRYERIIKGLPKDWSFVPISQLGKVVSGGTPSRDIPTYWGGNIPWVTPGELTRLNSKYISHTDETISPQGLSGSGANLLPKGSLLITTRATLGARAVNSVPMATNQGFKSIVFSNDTDANYYYYWTEKLEPELIRRASGTTFLEISGGQFSQILVPYPPDRERAKIPQILDTLDTQIRRTEALIAKLERIKQGLLTDLLTRGIDQNGQLRPTPDQAPHLYKDSPLGRIPREWDARKLCELTAKIIDGSHQTPTYTRSGVPFLRVTDIQSEFIDLVEVKYISQREHRQFMARCDPRKGDILLSKNGTVGIAKIVDWDWEFSIFVSLALIRVQEPKQIIPEFLETVLNSDIVRRQIERRSKQGTVTNLHLEEIRDFDIPLPSEEEQEIIAQHADTCLSRLKAERHELNKLLIEKSGLMDDLLTGRVRVTPLLEAKERATA